MTVTNEESDGHGWDVGAPGTVLDTAKLCLPAGGGTGRSTKTVKARKTAKAP